MEPEGTGVVLGPRPPLHAVLTRPTGKSQSGDVGSQPLRAVMPRGLSLISKVGEQSLHPGCWEGLHATHSELGCILSS